ncbi:hypothetical protein SAMN04488688_103348 [Paenibacillus sp. cl141a]|uniref:hypothetical protein n=1 Tax=Paenibacillus sp. cl141a TaxID=1761877 RepID=UPI0008AAE36C|nr:hypothetical protein [Paenibacillus sp. cl141a]SEL27496.1 hypothetical protein SAMN04488688_103348 [Paenibacillus sp. cl141a]
MKTTSKWVYVLLALAGLVITCIGGFVLRSEALRGLSGLMVGAGSVLLVLGLGNTVYMLWMNKSSNQVMYAERLRQKKIDVQDERSIRLKEKAGWKTNITMFYILMAVTLAFSLVGVEPIVVTVLAGVFIFQIVLGILLFNYYGKRM